MGVITTVGIDLAKNVFSVHGVDAHDKAVLRKTVGRGKLLELMAQLPPCLVGMEACSGAHQMARELQPLGHAPRIMMPKFIIPFRRNQENDGNDAEAICEAVGRPGMRFVYGVSDLPEPDSGHLRTRVPCRSALEGQRLSVRTPLLGSAKKQVDGSAADSRYRTDDLQVIARDLYEPNLIFSVPVRVSAAVIVQIDLAFLLVNRVPAKVRDASLDNCLVFLCSTAEAIA